MRLRAAGYMQYFKSRGRFTKKVSEAQRGDLVIYGGGKHIGIYLGNGRVISALVNPWGVKVHSLNGIHEPFSYFLHVNWGGGDAGAPTPDNNGKGNNGKGNNNNPPDRDKPGKQAQQAQQAGQARQAQRQQWQQRRDRPAGRQPVEPPAQRRAAAILAMRSQPGR